MVRAAIAICHDSLPLTYLGRVLICAALATTALAHTTTLHQAQRYHAILRRFSTALVMLMVTRHRGSPRIWQPHDLSLGLASPARRCPCQ